MNARPKLATRINCTSRCFCGAEKSPGEQWCAECWGTMPAYSAMRYSRGAKGLMSTISSCNAQLLKLKKPLGLDTEFRTVHGQGNEGKETAGNPGADAGQ